MRPGNKAFTLVELLVVVGIIALLIGVLLPACQSARQSAKRVRAMANVRELMNGYTQYHLGNRGALLYGYTPPTVNGRPVVVSDRRSGLEFGLPVADRYPWRLAEYCPGLWPILHQHGQMPPVPVKGDAPMDALMKAYVLSLNPSFGLNAIYLGGHYHFHGFAGASGDRPNVGKHVAFRAADVRRPTEVIVFAETRMRNTPIADPLGGLHYVTPPRANGQKWRVEGERTFVLTSATITGLPMGRYGSRAVVGYFDGHAEARLPGELLNMRMWSPFATTPDYDYVP